jgi:hypothetical protein
MFANQQKGNVQAPSGYSGLRLFDHHASLPVAAGSPPLISDSGNVVQLLKQVGDTAILSQMKQRIHEIKPSATDSEIMTLLQNNLVGLGETWYIYLDQNSGSLKMEKTAPSWVAALPSGYRDGSKADGNVITSSTVFATLGKSVDPQGEAEFNSVLYDQTSDPNSTGLATDEGVWTPSSGFNNLLGTLKFDESIQGLLAQTQPPPVIPQPTPTHCSNCSPHGCTFPWDTDAANLGPNATINQVVGAMNADGAGSAPGVYSLTYYDGTTSSSNNPNLDAAISCYLYTNGYSCDYYDPGVSQTGNHSYSGTDLFDGGQYLSLSNQPGLGQGFLKWYDQNNCGSPLIITDQFN